MDEDLVLIDNFHTETVDPSSRPTSPISTMRIGDSLSDLDSAILESKCINNSISEEDTTDLKASKSGSATDDTEDQPSGSKEPSHTQEDKANDQSSVSCVKKTKKPLPALPNRRKSIRNERSDCEHPGIEEIDWNHSKSLNPPLDSPPPPPPPPPPPQFPHPPLPPGLSFQPFMNLHPNFSQAPPSPPLPPLPPPPPPPPLFSLYPWSHYPPDFEARKAEQLIPARSAEVPAYDTTCSIVGIVPFRRTVLLMRHQAHPADYQEYEWLLRFAETEIWYEKPNRVQSINYGRHDGSPHSNRVMPTMHPKPLGQDLPKVWASAALTTSLDNTTTVLDQRRSKALKSRPLVYCLIISTYESITGAIPEKSHGTRMYKLIRCGSREAAVTEAYFAAGVHGYNVSFACVMRLDEDFAGTFGKAKKVEQLSDLALESHAREDVRVFY